MGVMSSQHLNIRFLSPATAGHWAGRLFKVFGCFLSVDWLRRSDRALPLSEISAEFRSLVGDPLDRAEQERRGGLDRYGVRRA
jgi:hypothetical protein